MFPREVLAVLSAAFAAGMVATVNPCGFAMLPAYLGYMLGSKETSTRLNMLKVGLTVAAGFLTVFVTAGVVITAGLRSIINVIPWLAGLIGLGMIFVGIFQLGGKRLLPALRTPSRARKDRSLTGMFGFGVSYAVASLSCTLPIFLSLLAGSVAGRSFGEALLAFVAYGAGMSLAVLALTVSLAIGKEGVVAKIRPLARRLDLISGWVLIAAGGFVVWYWATVLGSGSTALSTVGLVRWIDRITATVAQLVADRPLRIAIAVVLLLLAWLAIGSFRSRNPRTSSGPAEKG
ncbi:hypothetical protein BH18ACT6_BH18ACT6_17060 [soil metagenome]